MSMKFYVCKHCKNLVTLLHESGVPMMCCGEKMTELVPGTSDGAFEKHVPAVSVDGNTVTVKVGEVEHPMLENHYIQWVVLETKNGAQIHYLKPGEKPEAVFALAEGDEAIAAYEYCNLHGLWKKEL
ncbi:desulfoferrodoxin family protein [uncultured Clostridium sp.]|uniref:desulfoferrodoxin family protein n=1 Tax=uncultured Clostridium sp. TaxID=59620 RepID=UPI00259001B4|nr:desulfoferrodoxin family protein [uncultured Clostridium sp.]